MSVHEIRSKVISIPESTFYVESAGGRIIKVTQRGDDVFEFISFNQRKRHLAFVRGGIRLSWDPQEAQTKSKSW
jgi:hypothetical protein